MHTCVHKGLEFTYPGKFYMSILMQNSVPLKLVLPPWKSNLAAPWWSTSIEHHSTSVWSLFSEDTYPREDYTSILIQNGTPLKLVPLSAEEQFSYSLTHLLISIYGHCRQLRKIFKHFSEVCTPYQNVHSLLSLPTVNVNWKNYSSTYCTGNVNGVPLCQCSEVL